MASRLQDLQRSFLRHLRAEGRSPATLRLYGQAVTFFSRWLESEGRTATLDELTPMSSADFVDGFGPIPKSRRRRPTLRCPKQDEAALTRTSPGAVEFTRPPSAEGLAGSFLPGCAPSMITTGGSAQTSQRVKLPYRNAPVSIQVRNHGSTTSELRPGLAGKPRDRQRTGLRRHHLGEVGAHQATAGAGLHVPRQLRRRATDASLRRPADRRCLIQWG